MSISLIMQPDILMMSYRTVFYLLIVQIAGVRSSPLTSNSTERARSDYYCVL